MLVSILLSALVAKGISLGANLYFQETLTSLTGDYGEYDLLVQVREESREEGKIQMQQMLETNFPGSKFKEAPSIGGKALSLIHILVETMLLLHVELLV